VETVPEGYCTTRPFKPRVTTSFVPANVMACPSRVTVWPLITTEGAPGAAETTWPAIVAIAIAADIGVASTVGLA